MASQIASELRDQIHSPLAAIRNALYLISVRCDDFHVLEYVRVAEMQAREIAEAIEPAESSSQGKAA